MSATITAFPLTSRSTRGGSRASSPARGRAIYFTPDASLIAGASAAHEGLEVAATSVAPRRGRTHLHITKRGRSVLALVIIVPMLAIVAALALNGGGAAATSSSGHVHFEHVTVASGETLWQIAEQVAPNSDPRDVVADIVALNNISGSGIVAGQSLAIPTKYDR
ncbi:MAG: hypothetical protein JWP75_4024 [Frondihabitans sp.]|nr:hypothetical protein [Frondihabitans sp.]